MHRISAWCKIALYAVPLNREEVSGANSRGIRAQNARGPRVKRAAGSLSGGIKRDIGKRVSRLRGTEFGRRILYPSLPLPVPLHRVSRDFRNRDVFPTRMETEKKRKRERARAREIDRFILFQRGLIYGTVSRPTFRSPRHGVLIASSCRHSPR